MTTVTFENATFQDVIKKAAQIAPTRGGAFDKAAGIVIEIDTSNDEVTVRCTNLEVFYMEVLDAVSMEGESTKWILPSVTLEAFAARLPIGSGKEVTFVQQGNILEVKSGSMKAKLRMILNEYYPEWDTFDPDGLTSVEKFSDLLELVAWTADRRGEPPLCGIFIDGEYAAATDRFCAVRVPLEIDSLEPVVLPLSLTKVLNKHLIDVNIGISGNQLLIMPDDNTQIRAILFTKEYPKIHNFFSGGEPDLVSFNKKDLLEILARVMVMAGRDRTPALRLFLTKERIAALMIDEHAGQVGDFMSVPGYCMHNQFQLIFNPNMLKQALEKAPNGSVTMYYNQQDPYKAVRIDGGSGYEAIIMPRRDMTPIKEAKDDE